MLTLIDHGLIHDVLDLFYPGYRIIIDKTVITFGNALIPFYRADIIAFGKSRLGSLHLARSRLDIVEFTKERSGSSREVAYGLELVKNEHDIRLFRLTEKEADTQFIKPLIYDRRRKLFHRIEELYV